MWTFRFMKDRGKHTALMFDVRITSIQQRGAICRIDDHHSFIHVLCRAVAFGFLISRNGN